MSKSKGNLVAPELHYATVGADGLRLFHLFVGPPTDDFDWTDQTSEVIDGCGRFLDRLYRLAQGRDVTWRTHELASDLAVRRATHRTIAKVTEDFDRWSYNTAVAAIMELVNTVGKWARDADGARRDVFDEAIDTLCLLLAPMAPHLPAEIWEMRHPGEPTVHEHVWPVADPRWLASESVTMVVQVNGKVRARLEVQPDIDEEAAIALSLREPAVLAQLSGNEPRRIIARPPRTVNIVP
jgi:leucyl-tRNA synthetase